ncbi:MAG: pyridoxamine 5'-phosphate oxidase family protein [Lachnospiraceae bacterium]|nr:pyridoxamine 5'-phosphate oxidase family protein [Lachnospiraceae bacterium]
MFREMRRSRQALSKEESIHILEKGTSGVLALSGDDGYPYAVPISYVYADSRLYFHSAKCGHKIDAILKCPKASFCVIEQDVVVPEKYTTFFRSVIAFGQIRILEESSEIRNAVEMQAVKYHPDDTEEGRQKVIQQELNRLCMIELSIEQLSGKEAIELVNALPQTRS